MVEPKRSDRKKFKWKMINDTIYIFTEIIIATPNIEILVI